VCYENEIFSVDSNTLKESYGIAMIDTQFLCKCGNVTTFKKLVRWI
jgi:hypothetical protein